MRIRYEHPADGCECLGGVLLIVVTIVLKWYTEEISQLPYSDHIAILIAIAAIVGVILFCTAMVWKMCVPRTRIYVDEE